MLGGAFVTGISAWFLLKGKQTEFAVKSMKIGAAVGLVSIVLVWITGDMAAKNVGKYQPMKLAAMEGLYNGSAGESLVGIGVLKPGATNVQNNDDAFYFALRFPKMLSWLATGDINAYVPGINDILKGGYPTDKGIALSADEKIERGKAAIKALKDYRIAMDNNNKEEASIAKAALDKDFDYFGYGYIREVKDLVPPVGLTFYSFHIMVILGGFFLLLFIVVIFLGRKNSNLLKHKWLQWVSLLSIPLAYIAGQAGWVVAEVGRQPWAIQDILPVNAAISKLPTASVQVTFFLFLTLFAILLIAEIRIMIKAIKKGPNLTAENTNS
jgi:cytochrome d ubiquinol oxidase subunit I